MALLHLIEAPSNLGLQESAPGIVPAVDQLPAWLKHWGLYDLVAPHTVHTLLPPPYTGQVDSTSGVRNADALAAYSQQLAACLTPLVRQGAFALVLGGDCSILLGPALGLKPLGTYGLFFLDGHTDYAWPGLSPTGGAAGMDLALVTGRGPAKLTNLAGQQPYFRPQHAWSVGNRDADAAYVAAITASPVQYVDLATLRRQGPPACAQAFLDFVAAQQLAGFWIHVDVDVLDQELMPAVDSPQPDGLTYAELVALLLPLLQSPYAVGLDLTILDPSLDPTGEFTRRFVTELQPLWAVIARSGGG
jgi:arginase